MKKEQATLFALLFVCSSIALAQPAPEPAPTPMPVPVPVPVNSNVDIYGAADLTVDNVKAEGSSITTGTPDKPARWRLDSNSSHLGFRGSVGLMPNLRGIFQYETTVSADQSATAPSAGAGAASGIFSSARDSFVGVAFNNVGAVKLGILSASGRWINGIGDYSPGWTGINDDQGITAHTGGTTGKDAAFNTRLNNTVAFESAPFAGFAARAFYGAGENKTNNGVSPELDDKTYSLGLGWLGNVLDASVEVRYAYEQRNDIGTLNNTTANKTRDTMNRFGVQVSLPSRTYFGVLFDAKEFKDFTANTVATKSKLNLKSWQAGAKQEFGDHQVYVGYSQSVGDMKCTLGNGVECGSAITSNTKGKQFVLGYNYIFSKELMLKVFYSKVTNEANVRYDYDIGGISPALGADPIGFGIGFRYMFNKSVI
jgi:predicted porin